MISTNLPFPSDHTSYPVKSVTPGAAIDRKQFGAFKLNNLPENDDSGSAFCF